MSSASVRKLVLIAREKFAADFGADPEMFDSSFWDVRCLKDRAFNRTNPNVYFTRYGTNDQPLPADFSGVVKGWLILDRHSPGNMGLRLATARILWEAILARRGGDPVAFRWQSLSEEDLSQAELLMRVHWAESTTYKRMMSLLVFTRFLASRNLCRPIYYTAQTPRVEDFNRHTIAGQQARRDRLPSEAVLNGLADIYREHAVEPRDKLRAAALAILVVTGFRIGELLTLPLDCEVREKRGGQIRYGIRYYREKTRGGARLLAVRWLTPIGTELAQSAISQIRKITHAARQRAKVLEHSPHRMPIPGFHWGARMTRREVAHILGCNHLSVFNIPQDKLVRHRDRSGIYYRAFEVEAYLRNLRVRQTLDGRSPRWNTAEALRIAVHRIPQLVSRHTVCMPAPCRASAALADSRLRHLQREHEVRLREA
jgi:integrase